MSRSWPIIVGLAVAAVVAVYVAILGWQRAAVERREAVRAGESYRLEVAGIQQAHLVEVRDLRAEQSLVQRRLGKALSAAGVDSFPVATVAGSTGPVRVDGAAAAPSSAAGPVPAPPAPALPPAGAGGPVCILRAGESGEIRVSGAAALTDAGNVALDGEAWAYGLEPERRLFGGTLHIDARLAVQPSIQRGPGWGVGAGALAGRDGLRFGPVVSAPPIRLWLVQAEPSAALYLGGGSWQASGAVVLRRIR